MIKLIVLTLAIFLFFPTVSLAFGQNNIKNIEYTPSLKSNKIFDILYKPVVKSLDRIIHPLDDSPLNLSDDDLAFLDYLSDCRVVGLGEATHGTKEFFQLKHRIFRYLVENHGFKVFAFESDMGESYYLDNFVVNGEGDVEDIMKDKMIFWTWRTEEVKDLLLWMREYNVNKSDEDKIHFVGVDCQFFTYQNEIITNYFDKTNVSLTQDSIEFLSEIDKVGWDFGEYFLNMTLDQKEEIEQKADELVLEIQSFKNELISNSSEVEYNFITRLALNIKKVTDVDYANMHGLIKEQNRDLYMAQNTLWASDLFEENTKVAFWGHNGHVCTRNLGKPAGFYLREALKEKYKVIGFAFSKGSFTARTIENGVFGETAIHHIEKEPRLGSINYIFHHAKYDNFILRTVDIPLFSIFNFWISIPRTQIAIGGAFDNEYNESTYYGRTVLKTNYDVMINWDTTTAAEQLNKKT